METFAIAKWLNNYENIFHFSKTAVFLSDHSYLNFVGLISTLGPKFIAPFGPQLDHFPPISTGFQISSLLDL